LLLPTQNLIRSDLHLTEWTVLQINFMKMVESMRLQMIWGGDNKDG